MIHQVGTAGAGAELVVGPEHDVVGEELRAPVEQIRKSFAAGLGLEQVSLLDRHPGQLQPPALDLRVELRVLRLQLGQFGASPGDSARVPIL